MTSTTIAVTIKDIGGPYRDALRTLVFRHNLVCKEHEKLFRSTFDIKGPNDVVNGIVAKIRAMVDADAARERRAEHREFVETMEKAEKRRLRWGRLIGRTRRFEPLTRMESQTVLALLLETKSSGEGDPDARRRLVEGIDAIRRILAAKDADQDIHDAVVSTIASVRMRHLQQDVRLRNVEVPKDLRRRILAMRMPMDTWDE